VTVLVTVETIALILLTLLVAGLLRSHAEILRRLPASQEQAHPPAADPPVTPPRDSAPAADIAGRSLNGEAVKIAVNGGGTGSLVAFLSSGCSTCQAFWEAFAPEARGPLPGDARLIVVTKDSSHESPSKLLGLAPRDVPVVMSSAAWDAYAVPMTPYFVYVDGASGQITGEGTAEAWPQVISLLRDALMDVEMAEARDRPRPTGGSGRSSRIDDELRTAGVGTAHPSLYGPGDPSER